MIAHKKENLDHLWLHEQSDAAYHRGRISEDERKKIQDKYPTGFYSPNLFLRIGLFLLTSFATSSGISLLQIFFSFEENLKVTGGILLICSFITILILHYIIKNNAHYRSGVDDALEWFSAGCLFFGIAVLFNLPLSANASIFGIIALLIAIRYINSLLAVASLLAFSIAFFTEYTERLSFGKSTIIYALLLLFLAIAILTERLQSNYALRYYSAFLKALQLTSMLALYICGNFYIYRELGVEMISGKKWEDLPSASGGGWLFWSLTYSIPAYYILRGILNKKALFLRTGLILLIPGYLTYRYYHHTWSIELELLVLGGIFFMIAYFLTRILKETRAGYTSRQVKESSGLEQIEALIIADSFAGSSQPPITGGGTTGGGGASGTY